MQIRKEVYGRIYEKAKSRGLSTAQSKQETLDASRPGVVCEDQFWVWIRDVVISPSGYRHTYNRMIWKCDLERIAGASAVPFLMENHEKKFIVQLIFRHATSSWELEIPRVLLKTMNFQPILPGEKF